MTDEQLGAACDHVMKSLTILSDAAKEAKEAKPATRLANDLQHATNRAWHELDAVRRHNAEKVGSDVA